jgi:hypothetical protein
MSGVKLRGRWCHVIVLNVQASTKDEIYDVNDRFYEELECVFKKFHTYLMKILLGNFGDKLGTENFKSHNFGMPYYAKLVMIIELE